MLTEPLLQYFIFSLAATLVGIVGLINLSLMIRRVRLKKQKELKKIIFEEYIRNLLNDPYEPSQHHINKIRKAVANQTGLWFVANQFAKVHEIIALPQEKLPLQIVKETDVAARLASQLTSRRWDQKGLAIQYSFELGLRNNLSQIKPLIDHKNKQVRREAQLALVVFMGWKCVPFLTKITHPISLWQQIRIIEKLKQYHPSTAKVSFDKLLAVENDDVSELLMRIIASFSLEQYYGFLKQHITDSNEKLSALAIDLLEKIDSEPQSSVLNNDQNKDKA